jgi:hypothetical protein
VSSRKELDLRRTAALLSEATEAANTERERLLAEARKAAEGASACGRKHSVAGRHRRCMLRSSERRSGVLTRRVLPIWLTSVWNNNAPARCLFNVCMPLMAQRWPPHGAHTLRRGTGLAAQRLCLQPSKLATIQAG